MSRRQGAFTILLDFSSKLPWQVSVGLAVVSGLVFHFAAAAFVLLPNVTKTADLGAVVVEQGIHVAAHFFQFIVPGRGETGLPAPG
jgi:hypothetical protein